VVTVARAVRGRGRGRSRAFELTLTLAFAGAFGAAVLGCGDAGKDGPSPKPVGSMLPGAPRAESAGSEPVPQSHLPSKRRAPVPEDDDTGTAPDPGEGDDDPLTPPPAVAPPPGGPGTALLTQPAMTNRSLPASDLVPSAPRARSWLPRSLGAVVVGGALLVGACTPALPGRPSGPPPEYEPPRAWPSASQTPAAGGPAGAPAAPPAGSAAPADLPMN
jgi:hypothetical protein